MRGFVRRMTQLAVERWTLLRLLRLAEPGPVVAFAVLALVTAAAPIVMSVTVGGIVRSLASSGDLAGVVPLAVGLAVALVALQQAISLKDSFVSRVAASIDGRVRSRVRYAASDVLPFSVVESPEFQLDASRACDPGAWAFRDRTSGAAATGQLWLTVRVLTALGLGVVIATVNVGVALIVLVGAFAIRAILRRQWVPLLRIQDAHSALSRDGEVIEEAFAEPRFAREFAVFGFGAWFIERWRGIDRDAQRERTATHVRILRQQWATGVIAFLLAAVSFTWLGWQALAGTLDAAQLALAMMAITNALAMSSMGYEAWDIDYGLVAVHAYQRIDEQARSVEVRRVARPADAGVPVVEFRDVAFAYGDRPVLTGVTLRIEPGERVALVGRNGAGKSTLTKILGGLYLPGSGSVLFDGRSTADADGGALATATVAVMYQESLRLPLDLRGNVTMESPATDDEVWAALEIAGLAETFRGDGIELDTPLWNAQGESRDLSGGQWQRIALARAVFAARRGKRILVLDEPTSQFDVEGEAAFYNDVMSALTGVTVVLITHRLSTIRRADRIAMLAGGRITEVGSHQELMAADGAYAEMFRLQAERFQETS